MFFLKGQSVSGSNHSSKWREYSYQTTWKTYAVILGLVMVMSWLQPRRSSLVLADKVGCFELPFSLRCVWSFWAAFYIIQTYGRFQLSWEIVWDLIWSRSSHRCTFWLASSGVSSAESRSWLPSHVWAHQDQIIQKGTQGRIVVQETSRRVCHSWRVRMGRTEEMKKTKCGQRSTWKNIGGGRQW